MKRNLGRVRVRQKTCLLEVGERYREGCRGRKKGKCTRGGEFVWAGVGFDKEGKTNRQYGTGLEKSGGKLRRTRVTLSGNKPTEAMKATRRDNMIQRGQELGREVGETTGMGGRSNRDKDLGVAKPLMEEGREDRLVRRRDVWRKRRGDEEDKSQRRKETRQVSHTGKVRCTLDVGKGAEQQ